MFRDVPSGLEDLTRLLKSLTYSFKYSSMKGIDSKDWTKLITKYIRLGALDAAVWLNIHL